MKTLEQEIPLCITKIDTIKSSATSEQPATILAQCVFPETFIGFAGHFPENPVLPAIVQLVLVRQILEKSYTTALTPCSLTKTKFRGIVRPGQEITVRITVKAAKESTDTIPVTFSIVDTLSQAAIASGRVQYILRD